MGNAITVVLVGYGALAVWIFLFKLSYLNSYIKNRITLTMSSVFGLPASYSYSAFATFLYCILPILSSLLVAKVAGIRILSLFPMQLGGTLFVQILLGIVAAMSLVSVFVMLSLKAAPKMDIVGEMGRVKWIEGIFQMPQKIAWMLPMLSATFEEIFFRGVLLQGLITNGMNMLLAVGFVTLAFVLNQILLTDTKTQALVLGFSSLSISVVGSLMFLASGSIVPSILMHASFASFYTRGNDF